MCNWLAVDMFSAVQTLPTTEALTACRYSPNFSKRCTHLIVSSEQSDASQLKVYLASINKDKWHAQAVRFEWLMECATQHQLVVEDGFAVQPPRHEVGRECTQHLMCTCMHYRSAVMRDKFCRM